MSFLTSVESGLTVIFFKRAGFDSIATKSHLLRRLLQCGAVTLAQGSASYTRTGTLWAKHTTQHHKNVRTSDIALGASEEECLLTWFSYFG